MATKFILFLIVAVLIYAGICSYIGWNFRVLLKHFGMKKGSVIYWVIFGLIAASPLLTRVLKFDWVSIVSNYWMFFFIYGLLLAIVCNIISLILKRRFTKTIGVLALLALSALFIVGQYKAFHPVVKHITIDRPEKSQVKQLKIVMAADFHLGLLSNREHLKNFIKLSNAENPDVVLLAGDIVDDSPKWFKQQNMQDELKKLTPNYGVYGMLGNHEYIGEEINEVNKVMAASNVTMLQDESVLLAGNIVLTGRDDATNEKRKSLEELGKPYDAVQPWLVVDHQPAKTLNNKNVSLMMSGHTHNGQVWPGNLFVKYMYSLAYGHVKEYDTDYIVTSGYGFWGPPMRIGTQSEIWSITVNFK